MEERRTWLPAGLESPRTDPDDRASQRPGPTGGKRADRGPTAAGGKTPYDQDRPESKRGRSKPDPGEAGKAAGPESRTEWKPVPKPAAAKSDEAKAKGPPAKSDESKAKGPPAKSDESKAKGPPAKSDEAKAKRPPEQPQSQGGRSDVDAMGQEKHRQVVGQRYGASRARQLAYYGIFVAFVVGAYLGLKTAADSLDKAPANDPDQAPWSKPDAPQIPLGGFQPRDPGQTGAAQFQ